ncbi:MAG: hypothetical protein MUP15_08625 [Dehalococcoidia bacterium]|nr:hypothetical protein [Dehalococcoidia bacterium]
MEREYYSARSGKREPEKVDLPMLLRLFRSDYVRFRQGGYFDGHYVAGTFGDDIGAEMFRRLGKADLWPIETRCKEYSEEVLFDVIEFLYDSAATDQVQVEIAGETVTMSGVNVAAGRADFSAAMNAILRDYRDGYELSDDGEILALGEEHMRPLLEQELPEYDPERVDSRVLAAVRKFRRHTPSVEDKREAVRQLADVLEFLRPKLKDVLPNRDEGELFKIANGFGIRHHNPSQKTAYDGEIWLDWVFYCYLNTIHTAINLLKRAEANP